MLQSLLQAGLLLRGKLAELRIAFEGAALLRRRQIFVATQPVSGMAGLVLRRMGLIGAAGAERRFFLKVVPLAVGRLRLLLLRRRGMLGLGERRGQQQKRCQMAGDFFRRNISSISVP